MHTAQAVRRGSQVERERFHRLARLFFSGADPARLKIIEILADRGEACVSELAEELGMSIAAVSHHLKILRECRCLKTVKSGRMLCCRFEPNAFTRFVLGLIKHPGKV